MTELHTTSEIGPNGQIRRDRWGRYLLPHPDTGNEQAWTRATTLASTLADRYGLEQWAKRNVALGIGARQDLYARAAAASYDDTTTLNHIVEQAEEASKSKAGANLGSALHQFTERIDRGEDLAIPEPWRRDIHAYQQTLAEAGIAVVEDWIERVICVPELAVAGTIDRLVNTMEWTLPRVGDVKTAKDVIRYGMVEIALQLAVYAHGTHWWDGSTWQPMPPVDQWTGLVIHLPAGQGSCTLYDVDIDAGWQAVQLAVQVREWRQRKDLAEPHTTVRGSPDLPLGYPPTQPSASRLTWIRQRVQAVIDAGYGNDLAIGWPDNTPTIKQGGLTDQDIDRIGAVCNLIETAHQLPFQDGGDPQETRKPGRKRTTNVR